jgi:hypothetical protein
MSNHLDSTDHCKLSPKHLIDEYQLHQSQIAFTVCTRLDNGTYRAHAESTLISSVITEEKYSKTINGTLFH